MLTQPLLRRVIAQAVQLWTIPPATIYRASYVSARQARIAVFQTAYEIGCCQRDIVVAFGWSGNGRRHFTPSEIRAQHERCMIDTDYRDRYVELLVAAHFINGSEHESLVTSIAA